MSYYPLYYQIDSGLNLAKAPVIMGSASGSVASFPDGAADLPVQSLKVAINPVQDLHGYDNPWPAGGGKNLLNAPDITLTEAGTIYSGPISLPAGTYTLSSSNTTVSVTVEDESGVMPLTFILAEATTEIEITASGAGEFKNLQIESGSSATTYAPYSNICPISGRTGCNVQRTGKNLLHLVESEMITVSWNRSFPFSIKAGTYTMSCQNQFGGTGQKGAQISLFDDDSNFIAYLVNSYAFGNNLFTRTTTITEEQAAKVKYVVFECNSNGATYESLTRGNLQLELASTATSYEPYQGETYPITFPTEAGTVYGGQLTVHNDGTGELVVDKGYLSKSIGNMNNSELVPGWKNAGVRELIGPNTNGLINGAISSAFKSTYIMSNTKTSNDILWFDSTIIGMTQSELIAAYPDLTVDFVIPLKTPITYTLTAPQIRTFLGINNIWADTGDTTADYRADTKLYIKQLTQPDEYDMIADSNITSGKFFMVDNTLYLSTAAIEQGAAIVPGTNCTELSLADALNTLNT